MQQVQQLAAGRRRSSRQGPELRVRERQRELALHRLLLDEGEERPDIGAGGCDGSCRGVACCMAPAARPLVAPATIGAALAIAVACRKRRRFTRRERARRKRSWRRSCRSAVDGATGRLAAHAPIRAHAAAVVRGPGASGRRVARFQGDVDRVRARHGLSVGAGRPESRQAPRRHRRRRARTGPGVVREPHLGPPCAHDGVPRLINLDRTIWTATASPRSRWRTSSRPIRRAASARSFS